MTDPFYLSSCPLFTNNHLFPPILLVTLPGSTYNTIVTGAVAPSAYQHSNAVLAALAGTLLPGGGLSLTEPVSSHPSVNHILERSSADLISALKISGFVEIVVVQQHKASAREIQQLIQAWGAQLDSAALADQIEFVEVNNMDKKKGADVWTERKGTRERLAMR